MAFGNNDELVKTDWKEKLEKIIVISAIVLETAKALKKALYGDDTLKVANNEQ